MGPRRHRCHRVSHLRQIRLGNNHQTSSKVYRTVVAGGAGHRDALHLDTVLHSEADQIAATREGEYSIEPRSQFK